MLNVLLRTAHEASDLLSVWIESRRVAARRAAFIEQLHQLDDRQLADIGVPRGLIDEVVNRMVPSARRLAERRRSRAFEALIAMDDRQLDDIGVTRATIPSAVVLGAPVNINSPARVA